MTIISRKILIPRQWSLLNLLRNLIMTRDFSVSDEYYVVGVATFALCIQHDRRDTSLFEEFNRAYWDSFWRD
jgi:hypothetical protein